MISPLDLLILLSQARIGSLGAGHAADVSNGHQQYGGGQQRCDFSGWSRSQSCLLHTESCFYGANGDTTNNGDIT